MSKTRQWAMLTAVVCVAVLAAGWLLVIKPQRSQATDLRSQTQGVEATNATLRSQVGQLRQQQKDLPGQQKLLSEIATKVPDNPALPTLIRQLSAAADGAGVNLLSLAPGPPAIAAAPVGATTATASGSTGAASSTSSSSSSRASAAAAPLATIPLAIQVQGTYFNVEQFFSAVESLSRAMLVTGFSLTPADGGTSGGAVAGAATTGGKTLPPGTLTAQVNAQVFESPSATTGH